MDEILNLEYHRQRLVLKALNKAGSAEKAAKLLGITSRTVKRYLRQYSIRRCPETKNYEFINNYNFRK